MIGPKGGGAAFFAVGWMIYAPGWKVNVPGVLVWKMTERIGCVTLRLEIIIEAAWWRRLEVGDRTGRYLSAM